MKKHFILSVVVCILLTACDGQRGFTTVFPSLTPKSSSSAAATAFTTLRATSVPPLRQEESKQDLRVPILTSTVIPPTLTITPFPSYPNKRVVFDYYVVGNQADWDIFFDPNSGNIVTRLVLYDDGQLLIAGAGETYQQKVLSPVEIKSFLSKLETLGFYSLESNQQHDPTDKLYNFGNNYQESNDGLQDCILVNADQSKNLCVSESYMQFLIPKMKNILRYLDEYKPAGVMPYSPDRILLTIQAADPSVENPPAIPWKEQFPSLDRLTPNRYVSDTGNQVIYIDGNLAKEIYQFFDGTESKMVSQDNQEYILYIRVVLPHEKVTNPNP